MLISGKGGKYLKIYGWNFNMPLLFHKEDLISIPACQCFTEGAEQILLSLMLYI